ncbi:MAG TPA: hypothetical protein VFC01_09885 [Mycobacterium sp.]|nr:hypothetical protein [Mycobacterium sp.]
MTQSSHANVIHVAAAAGALAAGAVAVAVTGAFDNSSPERAPGATPVALGAYATPNTLLAAVNEAAVAGQPGATNTGATPTANVAGNTGAPGGTSFFSPAGFFSPTGAPAGVNTSASDPTTPGPVFTPGADPFAVPIHSIRRSGFEWDRGSAT